MVFAPTSLPIRLCAGDGEKAKKSNNFPDFFSISAERIESFQAPFKSNARSEGTNRPGAGATTESSNGKLIRPRKSIFMK